MSNFFSNLYENLCQDDIFTHAAALAFYFTLALAPLSILIIVAFGLINVDLTEQLTDKISSLVGEDAANIFLALSAGAHDRVDLRTSSSLIAVFTLLLSSSAIFGQMETSLNWILRCEVTESPRSFFQAVTAYLKTRVVGAMLVLIVIVIAITSLFAASTIQSISGQHFRLYNILNFVGDFVVFTTLFTVVFRILPQQKPSYLDSFIAGTTTTLFFIFGKHLVGIYLGIVAVNSSYGVAGLPAALFLWFFYSSFMIFLGAEILKILPHLRILKREANFYV